MAAKLEREGVASFQKSFDELLDALAGEGRHARLSLPPWTEPHPADELFASLLDTVPAGRRPPPRPAAAARCGRPGRSSAPTTLDLKIAAAALQEMGEAFEMFAHATGHAEGDHLRLGAHRRSDDPLYAAAKEVAYRLAVEGWMVITGAGPGIMQAAWRAPGARTPSACPSGCRSSRAPTRSSPATTKYVSMKYFFTRKLMLIKESRGFVCLPGGFGTLDETFELLTLTQTGKGLPVPIVFLDVPGDPYWETVDAFVREQLVDARAGGRGRPHAVPHHRRLRGRASNEIIGFYRNYDSHAVRGRHAGHPPAQAAHRRPAGAAERALRTPVQDAATSTSPTPSGPNARNTTRSSCRASRSCSPSTATVTCAR